MYVEKRQTAGSGAITVVMPDTVPFYARWRWDVRSAAIWDVNIHINWAIIIVCILHSRIEGGLLVITDTNVIMRLDLIGACTKIGGRTRDPKDKA